MPEPSSAPDSIGDIGETTLTHMHGLSKTIPISPRSRRGNTCDGDGQQPGHGTRGPLRYHNSMIGQANYFTDKEILENLGRALYECQELELSLAHIIRDLHLLTGRIRSEDLLERLQSLQEVLDSRSKLPLGRLLKEIKELAPLDNESERVLADALEKRNEIVHRFFYKHVVAMITPGGRQVILDDLARSIQIIHAAYEKGEYIQQQLRDRFASVARKAERSP